jgi:hypothetical protein
MRALFHPLISRTHRGPLLMLLAGIGMVCISPLAWVLSNGLQMAVWATGALLALVAWVSFCVRGWRPAVVATVVALAGIGVWIQTDGALHRQSWRIYAYRHRADLLRITRLMEPAKDGRYESAAACTIPGLRPGDCAPLAAAMRHAGVHSVWKRDGATMLETWGWVDARGGIAHCPRSATCPFAHRRVDGDWYTWSR